MNLNSLFVIEDSYIDNGKEDSNGNKTEGSGNVGVNAKISGGSKKWVTEQTSLTGRIVDIDVADKTTIKGAVIASTTGDLTLDTGSLEFSNIKDKDISGNVGGGAKTSKESDSLNVDYGFTDKRQTNFATIGEGTITVRDSETDLSKLNRDTTISQYNTKDGGLQGGFTVDTATVQLVTDPNKTYTETKAALEKGYEDGKDTTKKIVVEAVDNTGRTINLVNYGDFEIAKDQKMTEEEYKGWQDYKWGQKEQGAVIGYSQDGKILVDDAVRISFNSGAIDDYNDSFYGKSNIDFKNYNNILLFNDYLDAKLDLNNMQSGLEYVTDGDKTNLAKTLNQAKGGALSIQLQNELGLSPNKADIIAGTSCKAGTQYMLLKLDGADVNSYPSFYTVNRSEGLLTERAAVIGDVTGKYGFKLVENNNYSDLKNGVGGENVEIRIIQNYGIKNKYDTYDRHSIYGYTSDDGNRNIADMSNRGYDKPVDKAVKINTGKDKEYFEYFNYLEKKP